MNDTPTRSDYINVARIMFVALLFLAAFLIAPTPWSPMGQADSPTPAQIEEAPTVNLDDFDIPDGWQPGDDGTRVVIPYEGQAV